MHFVLDVKSRHWEATGTKGYDFTGLETWRQGSITIYPFSETPLSLSHYAKNWELLALCNTCLIHSGYMKYDVLLRRQWSAATLTFWGRQWNRRYASPRSVPSLDSRAVYDRRRAGESRIEGGIWDEGGRKGMSKAEWDGKRERGQRLEKRSEQRRMGRAHLSEAGDHGRPETLRSLQP